jgi:toxin YoeB
MRKIIFEPSAIQDLMHWTETDLKMLKKIIELLRNAAETPFHGIGKPEPLKYRNGAWSRRINQEHRIIYQVNDDAIIVVHCRYHYDK